MHDVLEPASPAPTPLARRVRVAICDDQAPYRFYLRALLEQHRGLEVVGEGWHGGQAIQLSRDLQPDVLVIDLAMPVMDGFAAIPHIRTVAPSTAILVLTASTDAQTLEHALECGADAVLTKADDPDAIHTRIRALGARTVEG